MEEYKSFIYSYIFLAEKAKNNFESYERISLKNDVLFDKEKEYYNFFSNFLFTFFDKLDCLKNKQNELYVKTRIDIFYNKIKNIEKFKDFQNLVTLESYGNIPIYIKNIKKNIENIINQKKNIYKFNNQKEIKDLNFNFKSFVENLNFFGIEFKKDYKDEITEITELEKLYFEIENI